MKVRGPLELQGMTDGMLEARLRELAATGRRVEARIVEHLVEVEARRLHLTSGFESMFSYCQEHLGFSEYEAFSRINAARMAAGMPTIIDLLERRELNLTTLYLVRDYVSVDNHTEIFSEVAHK